MSTDAIGTQVDIVRRILDKKAHCFLSVKENQGSPNEQITDAFRYNNPFDTATRMDAGYGRIETHDCRILEVLAIGDKEPLTHEKRGPLSEEVSYKISLIMAKRLWYAKSFRKF